MTTLAEPTLGSDTPNAPTTPTAGWIAICPLRDLLPERGAAALLAGVQVAVFRLADDTVVATANRDPATGANVISRGIVGTRAGAPTVASPLHKQVFDLRDGRCLEGGELRLPTYAVRVVDGVVQVAMRADDRVRAVA